MRSNPKRLDFLFFRLMKTITLSKETARLVECCVTAEVLYDNILELYEDLGASNEEENEILDSVSVVAALLSQKIGEHIGISIAAEARRLQAGELAEV